MKDKDTRPWWRDSRILIPGIIIPIAVASISLLSQFIPERVSERILMTVELDDPRREDPGEFDMIFTDEAEIGQYETQDIANDLADKIVDHLKSMSHTDAENKLQPIRAAVLLAQDGTLSVAEPLAQKVAMHLTRFPEFHDLTALFEHERTSMMVQHQIETLRVEQSVPGLEMTSGVYRLILTAPGYHDQFVFLQLSVNGRLFTSQNRQEPIELTFPMQMTLTPRSGRVKIAIEVFSTTPPPTSTAKVKDIGVAISKQLAVALEQKGFSTFIPTSEEKVAFDHNISKGMPSSPGIKSSDLLVRGDVKWID